MDRFIVNVRVGRLLHDFIIHDNNGSDLVDPDKHSYLWATIKHHLELIPYNEPEQVFPKEETIRILLRSGVYDRTYNIQLGRCIYTNSLFRCYLGEKGQNAIKKYFEKNMKLLFHEFMAHHEELSSHPKYDFNITYSISAFCLRHNLKPDKKTLERLRKDWFRYRLGVDKKGIRSVIN